MKKNTICALSLLSLLLMTAGCAKPIESLPTVSETKAAVSSAAEETAENTENDASESAQEGTEEEIVPEYPSALPDFDAAEFDGTWNHASGHYFWEKSSQLKNAVLQVRQLSQDSCLFSLSMMDSSEDGSVNSDDIAGVFYFDDPSEATFQVIRDDGTEGTLTFSLLPEPAALSVSHTGEFPISPDGIYLCTDDKPFATYLTAQALIESLPSMATSLSSENRGYTFSFGEQGADDWYLPVEVIHNESGATIARFLVANDLSAVIRNDDGMEPVTIFEAELP